MTYGHLSGIWGITIQYGTPILLIFLITCLITGLRHLKVLSRKLRSINQQEIALRARLQNAYEKHEELIKHSQMLQAEVKRFKQTTSAMTDDITGLPNYHAIMSRVAAELSRCVRTQCSCAILFVHLDSFNHIYATWGQDTGDAILHEASSRLQKNTRTEDFIGCYGGDNFVLLLVDADLAGAIQTAERLLLKISSRPYFWSTEEAASQTTLVITASIGIAAYGFHGNTGDTLIQRAESAMRQANNNGGNRVRVGDIDEVESLSLIEQEYIDEQSTLNALTAAASAHHMDTDNHAHRLVTLAVETAREIGCSEQEIRLVRLSALLHDIGKIGIPDAVLDKAGPLTVEEWEIMRLHPQIGQRILSQAGGVFATLAHIIVAHHERWDGKGYPMGLLEHNIPIEARILTVVDLFDAMTSRRIYRQPTSVEDARLELLRCAGSQFDPEVVIAFLRVFSRSIAAEVSAASSTQGTDASSISVI